MNVKLPLQKENPFLITHMGYGQEAPRSSLIATKIALKDNNLFIDLDVQLSKDLKLFVFHDINLSVNSNVEGVLADLTEEEIAKIKIKNPKNHQNFNEYIKPLSSHLDLIDVKNAYAIIEIKDEGMRARQALEILKDEIVKRKMKSKVLIVSKDPFFICTINKVSLYSIFSFVDDGYFINYKSKYGEEALKRESFFLLPWYKKNIFIQRAIRKFCQPQVLSFHYTLNKERVIELKKAHYSYIIWSPSTVVDINYSKSLKPYAITSDKPNLLKSLLSK